MTQERHRSLWFARFARGSSVMMSLVASVLALTLFTHVVTCDPCYDDDVCAAARIDNVAKFVVAKAIEVDGAKGKHAVPRIPESSAGAIAVLETGWDLRLTDDTASHVSPEPQHRNSALAHRRTVVFLV
jgi:hypothetical protein